MMKRNGINLILSKEEGNVKIKDYSISALKVVVPTMLGLDYKFKLHKAPSGEVESIEFYEKMEAAA